MICDSRKFNLKYLFVLRLSEMIAYERRYGTQSLRVLTVTLGERRLQNLKKVTEQVGGGNWFYFGVLSALAPEHILIAPLWQVAGESKSLPLIMPYKAETQP